MLANIFQNSRLTLKELTSSLQPLTDKFLAVDGNNELIVLEKFPRRDDGWILMRTTTNKLGYNEFHFNCTLYNKPKYLCIFQYPKNQFNEIGTRSDVKDTNTYLEFNFPRQSTPVLVPDEIGIKNLTKGVTHDIQKLTQTGDISNQTSDEQSPHQSTCILNRFTIKLADPRELDNHLTTQIKVISPPVIDGNRLDRFPTPDNMFVTFPTLFRAPLEKRRKSLYVSGV